MKVTLVHEVSTDLLAVTFGKEHVVGQHDRSTGFGVSPEGTIDGLEKIELFVRAGIGQIVAGRTFAAAFCPERRIGEYDVIIPEDLCLRWTEYRLAGFCLRCCEAWRS